MILDLFSGPRGWSEGLRMLGLSDLGIEWDDAACRTAVAAGHRTIRADVAQYPTAPFAGKVTGLIMSPPCHDFSTAGKKEGRTGSSGHLVDEVLRWTEALRPEWVACEQVPPALEVWREFAGHLRSWGYSAWCGVLNAADFGVPQTRRRAILLASRVSVAAPPPPTHSYDPSPDLFGADLLPWVTMAEALRWAGDGWELDRRNTGAPVLDPHKVPSPTLTGVAVGKGVWTVFDGQGAAVRISLADALTVQSFRPDYPVQGKRAKQFEQIGNAVPPLLAAHIISAVSGVPFLEREAAA